MKKWYESRIIISNIIAAILGVIPLIDVNLLTAIGVTDVTKYLAIVGTVTTILNVILRAVTTKTISGQSLTEKKTAE